MPLEQIQQTLLILLNKANKAGAFELEEANAGIQALNALAQLINQQQAKTMISSAQAEQDPPPFPPVVPTNP